MSKREAFLDAVCKENVGDFLSLIQLHKDKTEPFDVEEVVQELSRDQREALWSQLAKLLDHVLLEFPPERWDAGLGEEDREEDMEVEVSPDLKHTMSVVGAVTLVATASLEVIEDGDLYSDLLRCADMLHDVLTLLPVSEGPLQQAVHRLCEGWWKKGLMGKERFGRTAFIVSLQKTFILKKPGTEIQRVWSLREVLLGLEFSPEDNREMIDLLLQCFLSVNHIRIEDGKRFMVFLFSWNVGFIGMIHDTFKNQLEYSSSTLTEQIAEIYYRAWKKASGVFLEEIETTCIQDFMKHAILLCRTSPVYGKIRQVVSYFHKRKTSRRVDKMLYTLYKPILWRALLAANSEVRANATFLFAEAFPIHDPSDGCEKIDEAIQKQLDTLMHLLDDCYPVVRSTATLGVCKVLAKFWELIPATIISDFLKKLMLEMAADTSSPDVRCSVFKCLPIVLDNAISHPLLGKLLPALKNSLHDKSEKVRVAFLDMLLKVKAVRAAKFWDVCSMDHLLARLAIDSQPVSKRVVNLLFTSFFPANETGREWCCRCITLIQMNPMAARKFYQYAPMYTAPTNIVKLMLAIRSVLNSCIQSGGDLTVLNDSNKENSSASERVLQDPAMVGSLLEVVVILWRTIKKALENNKEAQEYTIAKFGSVLPKYINTFEDERCTAPVIHLTSLLPPVAVPTYSCGVLSRLRRVEPGAKQTQYIQLINCLCGWGQAADVLELVTDWLTEALPKPTGKTNAKHKVRIQETKEAKPDLALDYLEYLLTHPSARDCVLKLRQLKDLHKVLGAWRSMVYTHLKPTEADASVPSAETALKALTLYCRISAHLQHAASEGREYLLSLENMVEWMATRVLPFLTSPTEGDGAGAEKPLALARQTVESFLTVCRDVILVGLGDEEFQGQTLRLCSLILLSEKGYLCVPLLLSYLKEVTENSVPQDLQGQEEQGDHQGQTAVILEIVANIFQKIVELLARRLRKEPEEGQQLCQSAMPYLADFLQVAQTWEDVPSNPLSGVFSTLFAGVIVECRHVLQKMSHPEEVITPETVEDLPPLSSVLLSVVLISPPVTRAFLTEINSSLDSRAIDCLRGLGAVLHILAVIRHTGQLEVDLKSTAASVQRQLQTYDAVTAADKEDIQRVIYESAVKTLNEILNL